jgi:hypothetical protein
LPSSLPFPAFVSAFSSAASGGIPQMDRAPSFGLPGTGPSAGPGGGPNQLGYVDHIGHMGHMDHVGRPHVRGYSAAAEPAGPTEPQTPGSGGRSSSAAGAGGASPTTPSLLSRLASGSFLSSPRFATPNSSTTHAAGALKPQASRAASLPVHEEEGTGAGLGFRLGFRG